MMMECSLTPQQKPIKMLLRERSSKRPVQLGPWPLEALRRDPALLSKDIPLSDNTNSTPKQSTNTLSDVARLYASYYAPFIEGDAAPEKAPVPDNLGKRTAEIKGAAYYLDASQVGVCEIPDSCWLKDQVLEHRFAVVLMIEYGRKIETDNLASEWIDDSEHEVAKLRALEIACCLGGHIRTLGFNARIHIDGNSFLDIEQLASRAGIAQRPSLDALTNPFLGQRFALATISTDYELTLDAPLASDAKVSGFKHWLGINGAMSGRERNRRASRASDLSRYPMEQVKRVDKPTTLILDDEIPRVPKRAEFFARARTGDLGKKAFKEVQRFAFKHPLTLGMMGPLRALVPHQDGEAASDSNQSLHDATANTKAIKSLAYHLGADLTGICEIPDYAWYSHTIDGTAITPYHKYAVVMLIDQGYDTMEGASGDDWISGCQSMRGYLRGAEMAGVMAEFFRRKGYSARAQTNADSHVLQIPLVLLAGLGELSRIGELVLNPFVGPRFKSVVLTTDLPLMADKPIDFGLQYFCSNCQKCARECPVSAIPFGDKVMFNGYEIWKPDVERCTSYRVNNSRGSACGLCMKTCPLNKVVSSDGSMLHRIGTWLGINARWLKPIMVPIAVKLDDKLGFGKRNPVKRWWLDLEMIEGKIRRPRATNERDINPEADVSGQKSPIGYYNAADMPAPDASEPVPVNHKQAIERASLIETVAQAKERRSKGGKRPTHYIARQQ
ncbi:MAG: reductive dehalogenase domain-containing protein [Pseudomonadales bacterium]